MYEFHQLILLSHTNNCKKIQQGGGGRETILHLNLQGYKKSWEVSHAFALGKMHCNLKCYLITRNFHIAWAIHFF